MMQSAVSRRIPTGILLVPHRIPTFFTDDGQGKSMTHYRTIST